MSELNGCPNPNCDDPNCKGEDGMKAIGLPFDLGAALLGRRRKKEGKEKRIDILTVEEAKMYNEMCADIEALQIAEGKAKASRGFFWSVIKRNYKLYKHSSLRVDPNTTELFATEERNEDPSADE